MSVTRKSGFALRAIEDREPFLTAAAGDSHLSYRAAAKALPAGTEDIAGRFRAIGIDPTIQESQTPLDAINWLSAANIPGPVVKVYFGLAGEHFDQEDVFEDPINAIAWNAYEKQQMMLALAEFGKILGTSYIITTNASEAVFRFVKTDSDIDAGAYMFPRDAEYGDNQGLAVFNIASGWGWNETLERGSAAFEALLLHELGHGHGLAHPHDDGGGSELMLGVRFNRSGDLGDFQLNQGVHTVMSYNTGWERQPGGAPPTDHFTSGFSGTLSAFDIAVLQQRYGVVTQWATGNDTYYLTDVQGDALFQTIWDTSGFDSIRYDGAQTAIIDLAAATLDYSQTGGGLKSYVSNIWGGFIIAAGVSIEGAHGGSGSDSIRGNDAGNGLYGNSGNDTLHGLEGDDELHGGAGRDAIDAGAGADLVFGGDGNDSLSGWEGSDFLNGGAGIDYLSGGEGDDRIEGGSGRDDIRGGAGIDLLVYDTSPTGVDLSLDAQSGTFGDAAGDSIREIEHVRGSAFSDFLVGNSLNNQLFGENGNDRLSGLGGNDTLRGEADEFNSPDGGGDTLNGGAGDDQLYGGDGNDSLTGGDGYDEFFAGDGNDTLDGGAGNETINAGWGDDWVRGGDGEDHLFGDEGDDTMDGGAGNDTLYGNEYDTMIGGAGADFFDGTNAYCTVDYSSNAVGVQIDLVNNVAGGGDADNDGFYQIYDLVGSEFADSMISAVGGRFEGRGGNDSLIGGYSRDTFIGGAGDDYMLGNDGDDSLRGEDGDDNLRGGDGNDRQDGGAGNDQLHGFAGNDTLEGGAGEDKLFGYDGDDSLSGGAGADIFDGGIGIDRVSYSASTAAVVVNMSGGGSGDAAGDSFTGIEIVIGSTYDDVITGSAEKETLEGGNGNDTLRGAGNADALVGGSGWDLASYLNSVAAVSVSLSSGTGSSGDALGDTFSSIEGLIGSGFADTLSGDAADNELRGAGGNDSLFASDGNDILIGGAGADTMDGGNGYDIVDYRSSAAAVSLFLAAEEGSGGDATGDFFFYVEGAFGSDHNDTLIGAYAHSILEGGVGDDILEGLAGIATNDSLYGGDGNDTLIGNEGADRLEGGEGFDTADYSASTVGVGIAVGGLSSGGHALGDLNFSIERFVLTAFSDTIYGDNAANRFEGGGEGDSLMGGGGADTLAGETGDDTLSGDAGDDALQGDLGADVLDGGDGNDTLNGGGGTDNLLGGAGFDIADYGNAGRVRADLLDSSSNTGEAANDSFNSIEGLNGSDRPDILRGDNGANLLDGREKNDVLRGRSGDDTLAGGIGFDRLQGQQGADHFVLSKTAPDADIIEDFAGGSDKLSLNGSLFGLAPGALDADAFVAANSAQDAEDRLIFRAATGKLYYDPDGTGGAAQILIATFENLPTIGVGDFIVT